MLSVVRRIAHAVEVPVTADLMAGFGATPAMLDHHPARAALEVGVVGMNIDTCRTSWIPPPDRTAMRADRGRTPGGRSRRRAIRDQRPASTPGCGRCPAVRSGIELTIARARASLKAGASCVYPITVGDPDDIRGAHSRDRRGRST